MRCDRVVNYSLYLVTDRSLLGGKDLLTTVDAAIQGGATVIQMREKEASTREFFNLAKAMREMTKEHRIPFIINDRIDIALAVNADGIHIGQSDMPLAVARRLVGKDKIIGMSVNTLEQALVAVKEGADYLGVGAVFSTSTKKDAVDVSLAVLAELCRNVEIPVVAIGGISENNANQVLAAGVDGLAVVSAIIASSQPGAAAARFQSIISNTLC
ncbi:MAG: Thiamine-phosphate pyrophosphorylase [Firmicutes bacterium]|nr:Thiamine-phosphate pyrophosphorylase [Bacillota bacterium]